MDKPFLIAKEDLTNEIVKAINGSGLHLGVVEPILEQILRTVREGIQIQYKKEKEEYDKNVEQSAD